MNKKKIKKSNKNETIETRDLIIQIFDAKIRSSIRKKEVLEEKNALLEPNIQSEVSHDVFASQSEMKKTMFSNFYLRR